MASLNDGFTESAAHLAHFDEPRENHHERLPIPLRKKAVLLRLDPSMIKRFDVIAKRLGISRAAFIVSSAVKELERLEKLN